MPDYVEKEGPSVEEATFSALTALGISEEEAQIQVLSVGKSGRARVRVGRPGAQMPAADQPMQAVEDRVVYQKPAGYAGAKPARQALTREEAEQVKAQLEAVLEKMGTASPVEVVQRQGSWVLSIQGEHEGLLIGKKGATLQSLQNLANAYLNAGQPQDNRRIQVDVAGYRARKEDELAESARQYAQQARDEGGQVATIALSAADRRIVHLALQDMADIETFSVGEGELKRVVIQKKG